MPRKTTDFSRRSAAARKGWETRWDRDPSKATGSKGQAYLDKIAKKEFGYEYEYEGPAWEQDWEWDY